MSRKKISTTVYITPEQDERLKQLHARKKVPAAEYIRQGIDLVLDRLGEPRDFAATFDESRGFDLGGMLARKGQVQ
jgi:predicted DNA-binding protein